MALSRDTVGFVTTEILERRIMADEKAAALTNALAQIERQFGKGSIMKMGEIQERMAFDVAPMEDLYTRQGVAVTVEAVAQIKVKSDLESIQTAAEQFLTKTSDQRESLIRLVMEGHLRGIIGQLSVEQIVKEPEMIGERMRSTCADDLNKMGLMVISFKAPGRRANAADTAGQVAPWHPAPLIDAR